MRVIGVVDLLAGVAVHARAGPRARYAPVRPVAGSAVEPGLALARNYVGRLGLGELYAADLDAILARLRLQQGASTRSADASRDDSGGAPAGASQDALIAAMAALGAPLWLDAGVTSADQARH